MNVAAWIAATRPRTWPASLVPVLVGVAVVRPHAFDASSAALTFFTALSLQVTSNLANDYWDAKRGIDGGARIGPRRATQSGVLAPSAVLRATWLCLTVAVAAGVPLVLLGGLPILCVGMAAMVAAMAYSAGPFPLASMALGEVLAFVFFGVIAVAGTAYLQWPTLTWSALLAGASVGVYAAAIMLVNNLRDRSSDEAAGKRTLAVRIGPARTRALYPMFVGTSFVCVALLCAIENEWTPLVAFGAIPLAWVEAARFRARDGAELNTSLAATARLELVFGLMFVIGLWLR